MTSHTAREAYQRARELTTLEPELRFLDRRLAELEKASGIVDVDLPFARTTSCRECPQYWHTVADLILWKSLFTAKEDHHVFEHSFRFDYGD